MSELPPARDAQAGYSLMEVIVATAIASMIVIILLSAARNIDNSLVRSERALNLASSEAFDRTLLMQLGRATRPGYIGKTDALVGEGRRLSAVAFLPAFSPPEGDPYQLELSNEGTETRLVLTLRDTALTVAHLQEGDYVFEYMNDFGEMQPRWGIAPLEGIDPELRSRFPFATQLPRAIWIVDKSPSDRKAAIVIELSSHAFPPTRPEDRISQLEGL